MPNAAKDSDILADLRDALSSVYPGAPDVVVGIVDGLPDMSHPSLKSASIEFLEAMIPADSRAPDVHGTGICSVIFGHGNEIRGIAPGCSGLVLPIFFGNKSENRVRPASQLDLARAIAFALERGVSIINVSAGQKTFTAEAETHLEQALRNCIDHRTLLVAAAGNDSCACIHLPAAVEYTLAVGASDADGKPIEASNWGAEYRRNGLLAPGENILVAAPGSGTTNATGTSYATAVVSGVAALLLSTAQREGYRIDAADIRDILIDTATSCELEGKGACDRYLVGNLNAAAALAMLRRVGSKGSAPREIRVAKPEPIERNITNLVQDQAVLRGSFAMLNSGLEPADTTAIRPSDVLPSACSCQTKAVDEEENKAVKPQGLLSEGAILVPSQSVAQEALPSAVKQLGCSCGGGQPPQIVYALGSLWFDFGTEARYDAIVQQLGDPIRANNPPELFGFLRSNPQFLAGITFILMQDQIPLYAIQPAGAFALQTYTAMLDALEASITDRGKEQRVSLPGYISGTARLMNGMSVPIVFPDLRGMYMWRAAELVAATLALQVGPPTPPSDEAVLEFLNRVYYELRNLGVSPQERAMNYAATNAYQARQAFAEAAARNYSLDSIEVVKSPICRPDSDCWDVKLQMFDPENERRAGRVYRYTVDVSEVLPVTVGPVRNWAVRLGAQ
ncbi:PatA/PatG family cyanobactin maturation protease [Bradyrhizobium sp. CCGB20]|uniref:PatA/PatG family cyanobactin maturation protease n=1 Tax=Bradyrhizobium sp. CCGB20 TaxID=2949633 RepID=UPI0020B40835|nr:PatA/PatG family cyanobactin maturation protease [Bradyrhizobium sp. CCGB20]MCP3399168.1 PatA/PatG family cyanobactin maturation protease [Bradyrhizobium sp. CCGB20]